MKARFLLGAALLLAARCGAQSAPAATSPPGPAPDAAADAGPVIVAEFSNPALSPSHWTLTVHPDGSGHFRSQMGAPVKRNSDDDSETDMQVPDINRDIRLSPAYAQGLFAAAGRLNWFNVKCESHMKVAFQGWKTLSYSGPAGRGSCTFNFSKDKEIQSLGDSLVAVSQTIQEGVRLEMLLKHDPLGLDKEIENLSEAAADGRAQQICVIRGILERLAEDDGVMDMVRKRARALLARANS